jgi:hypothetical protein
MDTRQRSTEPLRMPLSQGLAWLLQSLALIRMQAGRLLLIAVFMQVMLGLTRLPLVGFLIVLAVPALTAGILEAFHVTAQGGRPSVTLLFRPLTVSGRIGRLFGLGALVFVLGVVSISLVLAGTEGILDPDVLMRIEQGDMEAIAELEPGALTRMVMAFSVGIAVSGTLSYFSIPLIWFGDRRLGKALVEGLGALFINWKPFLLLAAALVAVLLPMALVIGALLMFTGSGGPMSFLAMTVILILLLVFQMMLFGTQFCAYRDVFGFVDEGSAPPAADEDSQLLA